MSLKENTYKAVTGMVRNVHRLCHKKPEVPKHLTGVLTNLKSFGFAISYIDDLFISGSKEMMSGLDRIFSRTEKDDPTHSFVVRAGQQLIESEPQVIRWGLDCGLLSVAENYIGVPIAYRGLTVRRDIADGQITRTRLWHRDGEDFSILKIIVYVNDVDLDSGPFCCIHDPYTPKIVNIVSGRTTDQDMEKVVPRNVWHPCTGKRGTVVFVDTCRLFHKGMLPITSDRKTAFFCYNSKKPIQPQACRPLFDRESFHHHLNQQQISALRYSY